MRSTTHRIDTFTTRHPPGGATSRYDRRHRRVQRNVSPGHTFATPAFQAKVAAALGVSAK
jgi:hypothetical protein